MPDTETQPLSFLQRTKCFRRFNLGLAGVAGGFILFLAFLRMLFAAGNWSNLRGAGMAGVSAALFKGLRFDASAAFMILGLFIVIYFLAAIFPKRALRIVMAVYAGLAVFAVAAIAATDLQYFYEGGKHLSWQLAAYFGSDGWLLVLGAFQLHPWLTSLSLAAALGLSAALGWVTARWIRRCQPPDGKRHPAYLLALPVWVLVGAVALRGGTGRLPMDIGDSLISTDPYVNAVCMDPTYSVLRTSFWPTPQEFTFGDEAGNVASVRRDLQLEGEPASRAYPLMRTSAGSAEGNRLNVVIFILESWSAKDVGIFGGEKDITPEFDRLAADGLLFTRYYAVGLRTCEGLFSVLCSYPNQPLKPIMNQSITLQNHWRPLSRILDEVGYQTIFIHGRDLGFDHMDGLLRSSGFGNIIDCHNFPEAKSRELNSWPGYHDETVMRRANAEFAAVKDRPFLGMIYTMNTHPPFVTPKDFPDFRPPIDADSRFLNSLHYSDYTLGLFFQLARKEEYFKNTVFILMADHARTMDTFTYENQHHIPLLIYAPGRIAPGTNDAIGGQPDVLPTVLGLLDLKAVHAGWGRDLRAVAAQDGFAVSVARDEARWHAPGWLLVDSLSNDSELLFATDSDPACKQDCSSANPEIVRQLRDKLRAYVSLSQQLLNEDRVFPPPTGTN